MANARALFRESKSRVQHSQSDDAEALSSSSAPARTAAEATSTGASATPKQPITGTLYLFGIDRPGQLAEITKLLNRFGVTIMNLRVTSGIADPEKGEFVPATGGPLAENQLRVLCENPDLDETEFRREIQVVGRRIGYGVTCIALESEWRLQARLPSYELRRRAFAVAFLNTQAVREQQPSKRRMFRCWQLGQDVRHTRRKRR